MDIFHIGYILLLPALDQPDEEYGTKMARLLHRAQKAGLKTSIDVSNLTTHTYHYKDAVSAYHMLMKDRTQALSVIINWED